MKAPFIFVACVFMLLAGTAQASSPHYADRDLERQVR